MGPSMSACLSGGPIVGTNCFATTEFKGYHCWYPLLCNNEIQGFPFLHNGTKGPTVGTHCCETLIWDHINARMLKDTSSTLDQISA
jgi:hypothetical protein